MKGRGAIAAGRRERASQNGFVHYVEVAQLLKKLKVP